MNRIRIAAFTLGLALVGPLATITPAAATQTYVSGVYTVTLTNTTDTAAYAWEQIDTTNTNLVWSSTDPIPYAANRLYTYTRMLVRYGVRYVWVYRYVQTGWLIVANVPAHTTLTITGK
jgi:hypothetical protein